MSATIDEQLLRRARAVRPGLTDDALMDEALSALVAHDLASLGAAATPA